MLGTWLIVLGIASGAAFAQVELPQANLNERVTIDADSGSTWKQGEYEVFLLHGHCYINQGLTYARSQDAVLFIEPGKGSAPHKVIAYLEGDVNILYQKTTDANTDQPSPPAQGLTDKRWFGRFFSLLPLAISPAKYGAEPETKPPVYEHAMAALSSGEDSTIKQVQFSGVLAPATFPRQPAPAAVDVPPVGTRRVRLQPRSPAVPMQVTFVPNPQTNESVAIFTSGMNIVVDGLQDFGSIDVDTDRLVIWTAAVDQLTQHPTLQQHETPLEIYLEGNIVFRQGDRTVYANRMYYDVRRKSGVILNAEMLTPVPEYQGLLRLRADVLRQLDDDHFVAQNGSLTSSRFGVPTYELKSGTVVFQDVQQPAVNPLTGQPDVDPETGQPIIAHQRQATSTNNFVYVEGVPVFYWPTMATDLESPNYYIDNFSIEHDSIFGTQVRTQFDAYQIFGIPKVKGTRWDLDLDYLSDRGPAFGTDLKYDRTGMFDLPGRYYGMFDAWGIQDHGIDDLGRDRRTDGPNPDDAFRGRILARHRETLPDDFVVTAELGYISDRNFLEQYYEREWDEQKDESTDVELKQIRDNTSWSIYAQGKLTSIFVETEWLPRLDHFMLGQPLVNDSLTWYEHSNASYAKMLPDSKPTNQEDAVAWGLLPWEANVHGDRVASRQELDLPFAWGDVKLVPYVLGEIAQWGEDLNGQDLTRAYGQAGFRASLPIWSVNPAVQSDLFNLHGIAHKVVFNADISVAETNQNLDQLPLYDPLDDNAIEQFRRRFAFDTFGAPPPVPPSFDERLYALRYGLGSWVASPSTEIEGDMMAARLDVQQRWQTKRGADQHIVDWITLDTQAVIFPDADRDNFGSAVGLVGYDFKWNVGDRVTVVSDAMFDFFPQGPKYVTIGGFLSRPPRGSLYLGFRSLEGPISSNVLAASYAYRMSPKWISTLGSTYALGSQGNIGQNMSLTRIGEAFLITVGMNVDSSKGSVGGTFTIQPRFTPHGRVGSTSSLGAFAPSGGVDVPVAGAFGLE